MPETDIYRIIGENVRLFRKKAGLSLKDLSQKSGVSTSFLGNIEKGARKPTLYTIEKLSDSLDVPLTSLMTYRFKNKYMPEESALVFEIMKLVSDKPLEEKRKIFNILRHF